jgi:trehalose utilization protein
MTATRSRRDFLLASATGLALPAAATAADPKREKPVNVVVWDERQPEQKQAYDDFLGNRIAGHLKGKPGLSVKSVSIEDGEKGLSPAVLRGCDVLVWWGHRRQAEVTPKMAAPLVERIGEGTLSLVALHSAHWSTPFMEAMNERTRLDAEKALKRDGAKVEIAYVDPTKRYTLPKSTDRLTPYTDLRKFPDGRERATVYRPYCCFPAYRTDGKPSQVRVLKPDHPICKGLPATFELPETEMYAEPFHVPEPDEVVLEERWATGEWFRSGMVWTIGKGRVFYFRPGHETYPVFKEKPVLQLLENAVRWLAPAAG